MEIINIKNGNFSLNSEMIINANKDFEEVNNFNIDKTTNDMKNGYEWIYFKNLKIDNLYFSVNVCFFEKKTKMITLSFSEYEIKSKSWNNWSEKEEQINRKKFEYWLNKIIGPKREFNWGKISSNYDPKGGDASVLINYLK